jgi:hypothetical protein
MQRERTGDSVGCGRGFAVRLGGRRRRQGGSACGVHVTGADIRFVMTASDAVSALVLPLCFVFLVVMMYASFHGSKTRLVLFSFCSLLNLFVFGQISTVSGGEAIPVLVQMVVVTFPRNRTYLDSTQLVSAKHRNGNPFWNGMLEEDMFQMTV